MSATERPDHWRTMESVYAESAIHQALGLRLAVNGPGDVSVLYDGASAATNRNGNPAGGALAEMVDSAVVQAARTLLEATDRTVTIELKVNFVRGVPSGEPLTTRGMIDHLGRTTAVGTGRVEDQAGHLVAVGLVTVNIRRSPGSDSGG
ncbi:PaaI family thioesterase [Conexibacter sp. S30A1]|uniref:PaaI family thioesterase n=1 Tax=Conexibacter sp. S30A1 TaxID=2937800 RepID=UPI00200C3BA2|nr:PaaI family thioesterase [Conexibacter sp. S30A1]